MNQYSSHPVITETSWRALGYFNLYRLFISLLFVGLIWIGQLPEPLGIYDQRIFSIVAHLYLQLFTNCRFVAEVFFSGFF